MHAARAAAEKRLSTREGFWAKAVSTADRTACSAVDGDEASAVLETSTDSSTLIGDDDDDDDDDRDWMRRPPLVSSSRGVKIRRPPHDAPTSPSCDTRAGKDAPASDLAPTIRTTDTGTDESWEKATRRAHTNGRSLIRAPASLPRNTTTKDTHLGGLGDGERDEVVVAVAVALAVAEEEGKEDEVDEAERTAGDVPADEDVAVGVEADVPVAVLDEDGVGAKVIAAVAEAEEVDVDE